ncbi:FAD/NAD(P)-binding domain-containing protein [Clavulina sp. PMI_390]|nr:FAD/NAD(P)-binding domain-containing protein [Clavulina sp. PMI_390]
MQPNPKTPFSGSTATPTGELETVFADVLIQAIGGAWTIPKIPTAKDFPGLDDFEGPIFHSAAWRSDIDLKGKRVGVVGNAATGCQIVSALSKDPDVKVVNFARTPQWFVERPQVQYPQIVKWAFEYIPYLQRTVRNWVHFQHDMLYIVVPDFASFLRPYGAGWYLNRMRRKAPKSLHAELAPDLAFGCRRVIRDPGYYESLGKPNVSLETSPIANVSPRGVQLENGKQVDVDVLVMATGFESSIQTVFPLTGRSGVSLKQEWEQQGGPAAYYGTAVPGFPNHFMLLGPNTAAGHSSFLFTEEVTADYVMEMIQPVLKKGAKVASVEVKKDSYQGYNAWLQEKIGATVWSTCTSYYNNFGSKNFALYPGTLTQFWWHLRRPNWADWSLS